MLVTRSVGPEQLAQIALRPAGDHIDAGTKIVQVFRDCRLSTASSRAGSERRVLTSPANSWGGIGSRWSPREGGAIKQTKPPHPPTPLPRRREGENRDSPPPQRLQRLGKL